MNKFDMFDSVKIIAENITGVIVAIDTDDGKKPPIYFVEKDDKYKTGKNDLEWFRCCDIEKV